MADYRELLPPVALQELIECFWISEQRSEAGAIQRVVPDGCADIIYSRGASVEALQFIGPMSRFRDVWQEAGVWLVGVRFRPALWADLLRVNAKHVTDAVLALDDLSGPYATALRNRFEQASAPENCIQFLEKCFPEVPAYSRLALAVRALERSAGQLGLDDAADAAAMCIRQFRRRCAQTTGLSPKLLARVLRFRRAATLTGRHRRHHADLAAECGYADQSHLIADFKRFTGRTPAEAG